MSRRESAVKSMFKALIIGLILPACVLIGMFGGWIIGRNLGGLSEFLMALAGGIGGLILGSFLIIKLLLRGEVKSES